MQYQKRTGTTCFAHDKVETVLLFKNSVRRFAGLAHNVFDCTRYILSAASRR
jgi:hypothetical protein